MKMLDIIKPSLPFLCAMVMGVLLIFTTVAGLSILLRKEPPSLNQVMLAKSKVELVPELYRTADNKLAMRYQAVIKEDKAALDPKRIFKKTRNLKQII